jgi:hypothetical protein
VRVRVRRLDEGLRLPEGGAPRGPFWTGGAWGVGRFVMVLWHPDDFERARGNGVDVDRLPRAVLPDGREAPYLDLCSEGPLPVMPGSLLDQLAKRTPGSEEKRRAVEACLGFARIVHDDEPAPPPVAPAPVEVEPEDASWSL